MFNKLISSVILFLVFAQGALSVPQGPVKLYCGDDYPACPSGELCCGSGTLGVNFCQPGALECPVPT
ncbi:hypothetical protein B0H13DRAFT_2321960 [Mycena leptocephala]|nr:hypothetical protein B0H13DRAFT_2321960 [Mycena leptocephala]